jgi:hypothetical protein
MNKVAVVTGVLLAGAAGAFLFFSHRADPEADEKLQAQPVYQLVKKYEPAVYANLLDRYQAARSGEISPAAFTNLANAAISEAATKRLGRATDAAVNALMRDMLDRARALARQPGDACFRYLFPQVSGPPDSARYLDAAAQQRTLDLLAEVIRTSHETPVDVPVTEATRDEMAEVVNGIYAQFGADTQMMAHTDDPAVDRGKVCAMTIAMYERVMARPPERSSALIRLMTQAQ